MSQGGQAATLPRFGRRMLLAELVLDVAELLCCGLPLVLWQQSLPSQSMWMKVALPLLLAVWAAAALRMAYLSRPVFAVAMALRQGRKPEPPEVGETRAILVKAPLENALVHLGAWAVLAAVLCLRASSTGEGGVLLAASLAGLVVLASAGLAALRMLCVEAIVAPLRTFLLPGTQGIKVFADRYRGELVALGLGLLGLWQVLVLFFAWTLTRVPTRMLVLGGFSLLPVLLLGASFWWRVLRARFLPVEEYFDLALRTKGGKGPGRDDPKAVAAFLAAQRAPYSLAAVQAASLMAAGAVALLHLRFSTGLGFALAIRLATIVGLVSLLAAFYQTILVQQFLRPLVQHLGSRHALPLDLVRAPLGLHLKLGLTVVFVLAAACTFAWLLGERGLPPVPALLAGAIILGIVVLTVRDVVVPLRALEARSEEMANGQLARPVPPWGEADEIGRLAVMFETMRRALRDRLRSTESINVDLEREVRRRTEALEQRNAELFEAMEKLRRAQDNLVRTEKLASMGRLVAGIAHEINNPVNAVINSLDPLDELVKQIAGGEGEKSARLGKEAEEILAVVKRGAARTKAIVQALHGYARGDDATQREVDLGRSVDETLGILQHRLRNVRVTKEIDPKARIMGFPGQIDQVLMNLLTNAAQAIGERGGSIQVAAECRDDHVLLRVSDDGPGIPPDVLPRIFDPFFTTKDVGEGSGLGLSIVHGIIDRHGGRIDVDSKPGEGTRFSISFPLPPGRAAVPPSQA